MSAKMTTDDVLQYMSMSTVKITRLLAVNHAEKVRQFTVNVTLKQKVLDELTQSPSDEAATLCKRVFFNGWLNPSGKFVMVRYGGHEDAVFDVTGFEECAEACDEGWVKFVYGIPYNSRDEILFNSESDRSLVNDAQKKSLNKWLSMIAFEDESAPKF